METLALLVLAIALLVVIFFYWQPGRFRVPPSKFSYQRTPSSNNYSLTPSIEVPEFQRKLPNLVDQTQAWRQDMTYLGERYRRHNVDGIYLVHGTFVGDDPFGMVKQALKWTGKDTSEKLLEKIEYVLKKSSDKVAKDNGNFTVEYGKLLEQSLGNQIPVHLFNWSSENHHLARLQGAFSLIQSMADKTKGRYLLWGHRNAAQVFALATQLSGSSPSGKFLHRFLQKHQLTYDPTFRWSVQLNDNSNLA